MKRSFLFQVGKDKPPFPCFLWKSYHEVKRILSKEKKNRKNVKLSEMTDPSNRWLRQCEGFELRICVLFFVGRLQCPFARNFFFLRENYRSCNAH